MKNPLFFSLLLSCLPAVFAADVYVDPTSGDDSASGEQNAPLKSIALAVKKAAEMNQEGVTVHVAQGVHFLEETISLGAEHSGKEGAPIVIQGAPNHATRLSGGRVLKGWKPSEIEGVWEAPLEQGEKFRQLFIQGQKAIHARWPDTGIVRMQSSAAEREPEPMVFFGGNPEAQGIKFAGAEGIMRQRWGGNRFEIERVEFGAVPEDSPIAKNVRHGAVIAGDLGKKVQFAKTKFWNQHPRGWFMGNPSMINLPNEWAIDRENQRVLFLPPEGVNPSEVEIVVPHLVEISHVRDAKHLEFSGLVFEHSKLKFPIDETYHFSSQATMTWGLGFVTTKEERAELYASGGESHFDVMPSSGVNFTNTSQIQLKENVFRFMGAGALALRRHEVDFNIEGNVFHTIGGNVITGFVSPYVRYDEELKYLENIRIAHNFSHNSGLEICGSSAFSVFFCHNLTIEHNTISGLGYQGIHTGWNGIWNVGRLREVKVLNNDISGANHFNNDGGAFHTVGPVLGELTIKGNHFHKPGPTDLRGRGGALGVYLDNGTTNAVVSENVSNQIIGDINGPASGRRAYKIRFDNAKKKFPDENLFVSKFFDNHATSEHRHNKKGKLPEEKVRAIIDNAGVGEEFAEMEKFLPEDRTWEHLRKGSRFNP